mgnify:CR=1 FL=1
MEIKKYYNVEFVDIINDTKSNILKNLKYCFETIDENLLLNQLNR